MCSYEQNVNYKQPLVSRDVDVQYLDPPPPYTLNIDNQSLLPKLNFCMKIFSKIMDICEYISICRCISCKLSENNYCNCNFDCCDAPDI